MKTLKFITLAILAGTMSVMIYSCSKTDAYNPPGSGVDTSSVHKINIQASLFDPASLSMQLGTKVTWTNMDTVSHSIVADDGISFNSGNISAGGSFSFTPAASGIYDYHCGLHPTVKGTVYVVNK
jgi:plastocyanin